MHHFPAEYKELMDYLVSKIIGRHISYRLIVYHSEIVKSITAEYYNLYDITSSPLTSVDQQVKGKEINNESRIPEHC